MADVLVVGKGAPERGGIPTFLDILVSGPLASRHRIRLLNLADERVVPAGGRASWDNAARTLRDAGRVWRAATRRDVVHLHTAGAPAVTMARLGVLVLAARLRGARVVAHVHGGRTVELLAGPRGRLVARLSLRGAHRVVAVAGSVHAALRRVVPGRRLELIRNGVDLRRFRRVDAGPTAEVPVLLYVGLLTPRKGVLDLFEASRRLDAAGIAHELWLAGGTPDEGPRAEQQVRAAAPERTRWLGRRPPAAMPEVYGRADVFCLPSWWEGTPLTVLEAMAAGLPVVASRVGDVGELLDDSCGRLVPPGDPDALVAALGPLLSDPARRRRMGAAARARAEARFGLDGTLAALDALYRRLAAG